MDQVNVSILKCVGLKDRDVEILRYLVENRFATMNALEGRFWNGQAHRNHYRKLSELRAKGFIEPLIGDGGARLGYRPTKRAIYHLKRAGFKPARITDLRSSFRTGFDHDKTVLELRNIFEKSPLVSHFLPEHQVREMLARQYGYRDAEGNGYKVPDAMFQLKTAKREFRVALELELTLKSRPRYVRLLKQLSLSRDWDVVFVIGTDRKITSKLAIILESIRGKDVELKVSKQQHGFYFAPLSEFLERKLECPFEGEGKKFTLTSLADEVEMTEEKNSDERIRQTETTNN